MNLLLAGARLYKPRQLHQGQLRANIQHITVEALEQQVRDLRLRMHQCEMVLLPGARLRGSNVLCQDRHRDGDAPFNRGNRD